jgi:hypothetical protein
MHVHVNQMNPYAQLDAADAAQKAASKRAAEKTRKKLFEFASALAGEADSEEVCIVKLEEREYPLGDMIQENQRGPRSRGKRDEQKDAEAAESSISDWA